MGATIAERIKEGMLIRDLKQTDLVSKTGISKGALSSYISGRYKPKQDNIFLIAEALDVDEAWLMGKNVPIDRKNTKETTNSGYEALVIKEMSKMNKNGKIKLLSTAKEMNCSPLYNDNYQEVLAAAHERTDIEVTEEMRKHDDAIMMDDSFWE